MYRIAYGIALLISLYGLVGIPKSVLAMADETSLGYAWVALQVFSICLSIAVAWYLSSRLFRSRKSNFQLLPPEFIQEKRVGYILGMLSIWAATIGIILFFLLLGVTVSGVFGRASGFSGVPLGIAVMFYYQGVFFVEVSHYRWSKTTGAT